MIDQTITLRKCETVLVLIITYTLMYVIPIRCHSSFKIYMNFQQSDHENKSSKSINLKNEPLSIALRYIENSQLMLFVYSMI